jgi:ubiquinol-cytochrome c reductase cytochrome b subunit
MSAIPRIGPSLVEFIRGGPSVDNATLNRFFSLHYLLPFVLAALVVLHLMALHEQASNNPLGINSNTDKIYFHSYYTFKDIVGFMVYLIFLALLIFYMPNMLGHGDNYIEANPLVTPASIVPEFYLLPFYAILRAIPHKLLGVIAMLGGILILLALPFLHTSYVRSNHFRPISRFFYRLFVGNFLLLMWVGGKHVEEPFIIIGVYSTIFYFSYFLIIVPVVGVVENILFSLNLKNNTSNS